MEIKNVILLTNTILILFLIWKIYFNSDNKEYPSRDESKSIQYLEIIRHMGKLRFNNKINSSFDEIPKYYINLDSSLDRKQMMEDEIFKYNIKNIERFSAVDGKSLKSVQEGNINNYNYQIKNIIEFPEVGCTLSHLLLIKKIYDLGIDYALVLEDDMHFSLAPYWEKSIQDLIKETSKDWELIYLTYSELEYTVPDFKFDNLIVEHAKPEEIIYGACAYLISKKGCQKLVDRYFKNNQIIIEDEKPNIDNDILKHLNRFLVKPSYFINQHPFHISTITDTYTSGRLKNSIDTLEYYLKKKENKNEI